MKTEKPFPLKIRRGSCTVTIYRVQNGAYLKFPVRWTECGVPKAQTFSDLGEAKRKAEETATRLESGDREALGMKGTEAQSYGLATRTLKPLGVPIHVAAGEYAEAAKWLGGASIIEAAKFFAKHHAAKTVTKTVPEVYADFMEAQKMDGASVRYVQDCRSRLGRFAEAFKCNIGSVLAADMEAWMRTLKVSARTRNNFRTALITFFHFASARSFLPKEQPTEADHITRAKDRGGEIQIFKKEALEKLLAAADAKLLPYIAIRAFAGIRDAEMKRLDWTAVRWEHGDIEVGAKHAKTAARRLIPMSANLIEWLAPYRGRTGRLSGYANAERLTRALADKIGVAWVHNGLRHSFASYRVAESQDVAKTALEMGNSPAKIFSNYRALVTPAEARQWFAIVPPKTAQNIVPMGRRAA